MSSHSWHMIGGSGGMGGGPMDMFDMLFGGGRRGGGGGERKTKNMVHQLGVSLKDLYTGKTTKVGRFFFPVSVFVFVVVYLV